MKNKIPRFFLRFLIALLAVFLLIPAVFSANGRKYVRICKSVEPGVFEDLSDGNLFAVKDETPVGIRALLVMDNSGTPQNILDDEILRVIFPRGF